VRLSNGRFDLFRKDKQSGGMMIDCASADAADVSRLFKSLVIPRPIGWISTISAKGIANLAPYSFFNAVEDTPPLLMFSSSGMKDSARNAIDTGAFVCNLVTQPLVEAMNATSARLPPDISEFDHARLAMAESRLVKAPRVAAAAAAMECRLVEYHALTDMNRTPVDSILIIGQVVAIHVDERILANGRPDPSLEAVVARLGGADYALVKDSFRVERPR
jgi:flavin reductase (DIM6/NTAB) family NADH-FMN oxidoreductase RutF